MPVDELCAVKISGPYTAKDRRITNQIAAAKMRCIVYLNNCCVKVISAVVIIILFFYSFGILLFWQLMEINNSVSEENRHNLGFKIKVIKIRPRHQYVVSSQR